MAELYLAHYLPGDEAAFTPRPDMAEELAALGWDWAQGPPGPTWTLMRRSGEILGLGGFVDRGDHIFEAWSSLAELGHRDWPRALRLASRRLEGARLSGARELLAACRTGNCAAVRCLYRLGFVLADIHEDPRLPGVPISYMQKAA